MDWTSARQAVVDEFLRLRGATTTLSNDIVNRAICQALEALRPMALWFNSADLALTTVADQAAYSRNAYAESTATKLPWGFWRPLGKYLLCDDSASGNAPTLIEEIETARWQIWADSYVNSGLEHLWTLKNRDLYIAPAPDSADSISGRYIVDLGTPVPRYSRSASAWQYRIEEPDGTWVRSVVSAQVEDNSAGTYTDVTSSANSSTGDFKPLPVLAAVNDAIYFGFDWMPLSPLTIVLAVAGAGGFTVAWEYWNGAWTALTGLVDGTSALQAAAGTKTVAYTDPTDPAPTTVNSVGPLYWIRCRVATGAASTDPQLTQVQQPDHIDVETFSTKWFSEAASFRVLVARAATEYFLAHDRDDAQAQRANAALQTALHELRATHGSRATSGDIEPWMGDRMGGTGGVEYGDFFS